MRGKVLLINHYHRLSPRVENEVETLVQNGYSVHIVHFNRNGIENDSIDEKGSAGSRKTYVHLKAPTGNVLLVGLLPLLYLKLFSALKKEKPDIIHCTHLFLLPFCLALAKLRGIRVIYDAYEMHAVDWAAYVPSPFSKLCRKLIEFIENLLVARVDGVLTIDSVGDFLATRYRLVNPNVVVLYNVPKKDILIPLEDFGILRNKYAGFHVLAYVGGAYEAKGLMAVLEALAITRKRSPCVRLLFIGSFDDPDGKAQEYMTEAKLQEAVETISWVSYEKLLCYLEICSIGLALYQPQGHFLYTSRGNGRKFFTYMQAGLPIIGPSFSEIGIVVREERCGLLVDATEPVKIAEAILYLLDHPEEAHAMGKRGRRAVERKYNWQREQYKLLQVYKRLNVEPAWSE